MEEWIELFARHGFYRNVQLDADVVAPHAVHLVRSAADPVEVARGYERWSWSARSRAEAEIVRLTDEKQQLSDEVELATAELAEWNLFRSRSGYRFFRKMEQLRLKVAPKGTARDRIARKAMRRAADLVDRPTKRVTPAGEALRAVLFVSACPGDARRYRCDHQAAQLARRGATVDVVDYDDVDLERALDSYAAFVLHRVPWSGDVRGFLERAHLEEKPVLFDTDDLVFEPEAHEHVAALRELDEAERSLYVHGLRRFRQTLRECDGVLVSTEPLRRAASRYHDRVEVAYNAVSDEMVRYADVALAAVASDEKAVTISYFSGTPTHNVDFLEVADAVLWALERYPAVTFRAVGSLTLDARFDAHGARVQRVPLQPWERLPELFASTDINLAPLEPRNPFTECKSCLKYIEAGLVGKPTIASPRTDFVRAIEHGRNGLLADTPEEWREAIETLVESPERRRDIGRAAFEDVRRSHTVRARSGHLLSSVASLAGGDDSRPLTVNWVVGETNRDDELRNVLELADHLGRRGHIVRLYMDSVPTGDVHAEVHAGHDAIAPADVTLSTDEATARVVAAHDSSLFKLDYGNGLAESGDQLERILRETCFVRLWTPQAPTRS
jgi:glycosyltransferase involved in cell wall biosynthesis